MTKEFESWCESYYMQYSYTIPEDAVAKAAWDAQQEKIDKLFRETYAEMGRLQNCNIKLYQEKNKLIKKIKENTSC